MCRYLLYMERYQDARIPIILVLEWCIYFETGLRGFPNIINERHSVTTKVNSFVYSFQDTKTGDLK